MKTIFVVDDSDTNLAKVEEALGYRYCVFTIPSAEKMFTLLEKITPDLILLDIEMPDTDGFAALQHLKALDSYSNIPVIFLTGTIDASIEEKSAKLGAVGIVTKPFTPSVLLKKVNLYI